MILQYYVKMRSEREYVRETEEEEMRDEDDSLCCTARGILYSFHAECAGGFTLISLAGVL
jgi:hypothetical protein